MHQQIQQALREAIRARRVQPGAAVPSTRTLAADLGVSRGVVVQAYDQLIAEGYLISTQGAPIAKPRQWNSRTLKASA
jgi:GntR family transcriptional regulator/MocR family aminotransferase